MTTVLSNETIHSFVTACKSNLWFDLKGNIYVEKMNYLVFLVSFQHNQARIALICMGLESAVRV